MVEKQLAGRPLVLRVVQGQGWAPAQAAAQWLEYMEPVLAGA